MSIAQYGLYDKIHTERDVLKEKLAYGSELTGQYGFPYLPPVRANFDGLKKLKAVSFQKATKEKRPKEAVCHFFADDYIFERVWNDTDRYIEMLSYFKYVCSPDFSIYSQMPLTLQLYNTYRNRAVANYLTANGLSVIPTVSWCDKESYEWCFDGLPHSSTLAVSTNGCFFESGIKAFQDGFKAMCDTLEPYNVLIIGRELPLPGVNVDVVYMESEGQITEQKAKEVIENGRS